MFRFRLANFAFVSTAWDPLSVAGGRARYQGSGTLNCAGAGAYRFLLTATGGPVAGAATGGRFGLKIWHADARTGVDVVDYDNQGGTGAALAPGEGSAVAGGGIVIGR